MRPLGWQDRALCTHYESFRHTKCLSYFSLRIVGHSPTLWDRFCCPLGETRMNRNGDAAAFQHVHDAFVRLEHAAKGGAVSLKGAAFGDYGESK